MNETVPGNNTILQRLVQLLRKNNCLVFAILWVILFVLYLPAAHAGWVSDVDELINRIENGSFWNFINAKLSRGNLYHVSWLAFYFIYRLFLINPYLSYVFIISLQAVNATLIFNISNKLFEASGVKKAFAIAGGGALLFCIAPHISEVVVWKAAFHYILAMLLMLGSLWNVQQFLSTAKSRNAWAAVALFLIASFSHEFFYLTPFFVLTTILYYRFVLRYDKEICKKALVQFFIPLCAVIAFHQLLLTLNTGTLVGTLESEVHQSALSYLRKPPLYLFHVIFFGRYFAADSSRWIYDLFSSWTGVAAFYALAAIFLTVVTIRFRKMPNHNKVFILIACWMAACMALVAPMWFSNTLLVSFDRYSYYMLPFLYLLLMFLLVQFPARAAVLCFIIYCGINIYFTKQVNTYWHYSAQVKNRLIHSFPATGDKTVLVLNLPEYMNGAPIYGPWWHFSFRQVHNLYNSNKITAPMYDVASYNMAGPADGAHVLVINDSMIHVTLNQWGTWWWANLIGAFSYENADYKFNLIDPGHWYELTLKHPADQYVLIYQVGYQWKVVDMKRRDDQY